MKTEVAEMIATAADSVGVNVTLRAGYSGRGMNGKTTAAVVADDLAGLLAAVSVAAGDAVREGRADDSAALTRELARAESDQMGRGVVLY